MLEVPSSKFFQDEQDRVRQSSKSGQPINLEFQPFSESNGAEGTAKYIKFGTNIDLSDPLRWRPQLEACV